MNLGLGCTALVLVPPEMATSGVPYWAFLPKVLRVGGSTFLPHARGLVRPERKELRAERPERVELGSLRQDGAAVARRGVTEDLRRADVGLELDLRVRFPAGPERPDVLESSRMVPEPVRPCRPRVEEESPSKSRSPFWYPVVETLARGRELGRRHTVGTPSTSAVLALFRRHLPSANSQFAPLVKLLVGQATGPKRHPVNGIHPIVRRDYWFLRRVMRSGSPWFGRTNCHARKSVSTSEKSVAT